MHSTSLGLLCSHYLWDKSCLAELSAQWDFLSASLFMQMQHTHTLKKNFSLKKRWDSDSDKASRLTLTFLLLFPTLTHTLLSFSPISFTQTCVMQHLAIITTNSKTSTYAQSQNHHLHHHLRWTLFALAPHQTSLLSRSCHQRWSHPDF